MITSSSFSLFVSCLPWFSHIFFLHFFYYTTATATAPSRIPSMICWKARFYFSHHDYDRYLKLKCELTTQQTQQNRKKTATQFEWRLTCCGCRSNMLDTARLSVRLRRTAIRSSPRFVVSDWDRSDIDAPERREKKHIKFSKFSHFTKKRNCRKIAKMSLKDYFLFSKV